MLGSKRLRLISFTVIFFSLLINLLFIGNSQANPLVISGSNQMSTGATQTLTVSGGRGPYTWGITSGGGSLSGASGKSVNYTAPGVNPSCTKNSIIGVTDSCGQTAYIGIAVNSDSESTVTASVMYTAADGRGCSCTDTDGCSCGIQIRNVPF